MRVFVYGSLMQGFGNHRLLAKSLDLGFAVTVDHDYAMLDLGAFPGVIEGDAELCNAAICGEVYFVDEPTLARLDRLEGHPTYYRRELRPINQGGERRIAWIYLYQAGSGGRVIAPRQGLVSWRDYCNSARTGRP